MLAKLLNKMFCTFKKICSFTRNLQPTWFKLPLKGTNKRHTDNECGAKVVVVTQAKYLNDISISNN